MGELTNKQKKEWAKTLYIQEGLSQKEIAEKVGVSKVSVNKWANDPAENWERLKQSMLITRETQLRRMYAQLDELTSAIAKREEGARFASSKEADTINKYTSAIRALETEASIADVVEVCKRLLSYLRPISPQRAKDIAPVFDDFIKHLLKK